MEVSQEQGLVPYRSQIVGRASDRAKRYLVVLPV